VVDTTKPTFTTSPANVTVQCSASTDPSNTGTAAANDNCDTSVTVAYADTTAAGTGNNSVITRVWTATDDNSNSTTHTQTITVVDTTPPVADIVNLADVTAECSVETLTAPTATDNCAGTINGIITEISVYINWNVNEPNNHNGGENYGMILDNGKWNDHRGNNSNPDFIMESDSDLGVISGFNFIGSYNGHYYYQSTSNHTWNNANNIAVSSGGYLVIITSEGENEFIEQNAVITIHGSWIGMYQDTSNSSYSEPAGGWYWVNGSEVNTSTNTTLPITAQGATVITWTFTDDNGNTTTQTQNVIIDDVTGPIFTTSPASVTVQCDTDTSATTLGSATATDNCGGTVAVTSTDTAVSDIGNNSVITRVWTATDVNGNVSTYTQTITVVDTRAPVVNVATLADVSAECSVDALDAPTATDNCAGLKRGTTTTSFPITTQGTTVVTWTYTDENGNTTTQDQNIVIDDTTAPVADASSLADVTAQCSVTSLTAPTATDNCAGSVTVTNNASLPITTQGTTVVTWTYTDENGNTTTQDQNIVIDDTTAPVADASSLADVTAQCSVTSLTAPTATDNCAGSVTVTNNASLPITTQGITVVTWTYTDENGNTTTQDQNIVIDDTTAPVADASSLADVTAQCSVTSLTAPTATDNCAGSVTGTTTTSFPITTQGTTVVTWTFDDGNGNTTTQDQNIVIDDTTAPVADASSLADVTAQCSVTSLTAPTATDNCAGSVTVTNNASLPITTQGITVVTWTYTDENGNTTTQDQNIVIDDTTAPVADASSLADVTAQCSVTSLTAPTATDNCAGSVTVTNNASLPITTQGITVVTWTYTDENGNTTTQDQNIVIDDTTAPVADASSLADVTAQCSVTSLTAPTATDNCAGSVTVTNNASLPITTQGTTVVTWTYTDENGNTTTQDQNIVIDDTTAPVADASSLADVTAQCSVTSLTAPTATDNCAGSVTVTNNASLPITTQGTTVVTWTYTDENGNTTTQDQNIVIDDTTAPVADASSLADVTAQCSVTSLTAPTATDNCAGSVTVTNNASLPITTQGTTVVTWTYTDENGNTTTQDQNIVIDDTTAPVADASSLADVTAQCSVTSLTAPTATDNCAGSVTVTNNASLPITTQGITVVTWTYTDENGNTTTQDQNIVIDDTTAPVADASSLADVTAQCSVTSLTAPTATDNCAGSVTVTNNASLPITTQGTTVVTWTFD
jgi:hypothetical protein